MVWKEHIPVLTNIHMAQQVLLGMGASANWNLLCALGCGALPAEALKEARIG